MGGFQSNVNLLSLWILLSFTLQIIWNLKNNNNRIPHDSALYKSKVHGDWTNTNPTTVYGHLHIAKTGGSNTNILLAQKYDNVCGNKASSYNAYRISKERIEDGLNNTFKPGRKGVAYNKLRKEIGFADCDYISLETSFGNWKKHVVDHLEFANRNLTLELHVPCRDPIEHLLSACNHRGKTFECPDINDEEALASEVTKCLWSKAGSRRPRFDPILKSQPNIRLKCFPSFPINNYVNYMGQFLHRRRIEAPRVQLKTNRDRVKKEECLLAQDEKYVAKVKEMALKLDIMGYYKYCDECIGSSDELKLT